MTYLMEDAWESEDAWNEELTEQTDNHTAPKNQLVKATKDFVKAVKDYIDENYQEQLSLQNLANRFYINKEYLTKLFKETYGYTVNGYISHVRISRAKELLRFTDMTVSEIGYAVGIADENYFSRVFKRVEGISPSKYRASW